MISEHLREREIIKQGGGFRNVTLLSLNGFFVTDWGNYWKRMDHKASICPATSVVQQERRLLHTEVSDCSLMTNLWLFGSMNSSPSRRKGSGVTVTTREKSRRRRENTRP